MSRWAGFVVAIGVAAWSGCSPYTDYCKKFTACANGNAKDEAVCRDLNDTFDKVAVDYGCEDKQARLRDCFISKAQCTDHFYSAGLECNDLSKAVNECTGGHFGVQ